MDPRIEKILKMPLYQRVLILLILAAVIVGGYVYLLHLPAQEELQRLQKENDRVLMKLQESRRIANNLPRFKAEYEKMQQRLNDALRELPNKSEIPSLLSSIAGMARDNGLEVKEFKPGKEVIKDFYADVPVSLKLAGSYHEMALFCQSVSNLDRIVNIRNLNMGKAKIVDGRALLSISAQAVTYRFVDKPDKPAKKRKKKR